MNANNNCSVPTMDGYRNIPFCIYVSVLVHPMHFSSVMHFQPAGTLSTLGVSGIDQFNFLISAIMVIFLALVEEAKLWYTLIALDKFSDQFLSKLIKIGRYVNPLICFSCLVFSSTIAISSKLTYLENGTCPFSFSLSSNFSVRIFFAICCLACLSFAINLVGSIYLAKSELVDSCHSLAMKNNYQTLLHSLILRTLITLSSVFVAPLFVVLVFGSDYVPGILKLILANHGILSTVISVIAMIRVQYFKSRIGVVVNADAASNSVNSIRI